MAVQTTLPRTALDAMEEAIRIKYIVPFPLDEVGLANRAAQLPDELRTPGVDYDFVPVKNSCHNADGAYELLILDAYIAEAGLASEEEGYDAVVMDTVSDSGLAALRSRLTIPVLGPGQVQQHVAAILGKRFFDPDHVEPLGKHVREGDGRIRHPPLLRVDPFDRRAPGLGGFGEIRPGRVGSDRVMVGGVVSLDRRSALVILFARVVCYMIGVAAITAGFAVMAVSGLQLADPPREGSFAADEALAALWIIAGMLSAVFGSIMLALGLLVERRDH